MSRSSPDVGEALDAAVRLPDQFDSLKSRLGKDLLMRWDDYPDVTLHKLEILARSAYLAGVYLIHNSHTAYRAEDLVRAVLECLAHSTYIASLPPLSYRRTPADRALCVELGMVKGLNDLLKKLPNDALMQDPAVRTVVAADEQAIKTLHNATGCKCTGRDDGNVAPTLKDAATAIGPPWRTLVGVYASSSTFMHQALLNRIVREVSPGVTDWVPADDEHRIRLLTWLVVPYGLIGTQILFLHDQTIAKDFHERSLAVLRQFGSVAPAPEAPG